MAKGKEAGSSFLSGVLARLSPEDRAKGQEVIAQLGTIGDGALVAAVGDGTLAQSEFSRLSDQIKQQEADLKAREEELEGIAAQQQTTYSQQTQWWEQNQARLAEAERLKRSGGNGNGDGGVKPGSVPPNVVTEEKLQEWTRSQTSAFLQYTSDRDHLTKEHFARFGNFPDLDSLLSHPQIKEVGLRGVYAIVNKDALEKHDQEKAKKAEEAIRLDERQKVLQAGASMPYPVGSDAMQPGSPLDALQGASDQVTDKAVAEYHKILADRMAGRIQ